MSNKEIKFTIKLNVDGKEQLGAITASAKDVKEAFDAASTINYYSQSSKP